MAQIGWNTGAMVPRKSLPHANYSGGPPRHVCILGYASVYTKKSLPNPERERQDHDMIGAMSILWALVLAYIPTDITEYVKCELDKNYPSMGTYQVPPGKPHPTH